MVLYLYNVCVHSYILTLSAFPDISCFILTVKDTVLFKKNYSNFHFPKNIKLFVIIATYLKLVFIHNC